MEATSLIGVLGITGETSCRIKSRAAPVERWSTRSLEVHLGVSNPQPEERELKERRQGLYEDMGMLEKAKVTTASFETFIVSAEPRLRRAFVARFGVEQGNDVTADVLAYAWEHWSRLAATSNPVGYLYRVGQSRARRYRRWARPVPFPIEPAVPGVRIEPGLGTALSRLNDNQRVAVILVHCYGWTYADAAESLGIPISTFRNHLHRGMTRLRTNLETE